MPNTQSAVSTAVPRRPKPRPRHPQRYTPPLALPSGSTQDLRPPAPFPEPRPTTVQREKTRPSRRPLPVRTPAERALLAVLVFGLVMNAAALLGNAGLSRSDRWLGVTVLLAGLALLVTLELCRRTAPPTSGGAGGGD